MRLKKSVKRVIRIILCFLSIIFIGIIIFSGYKIAVWYRENKQSSNITKIVRDYIVIDNKTDNEYHVDFNKLKGINSDVVAYLKVNNTKIDYPVVKTEDNAYYLSHSFDKSTNSAGWVFGNYQNEFDGTDYNISIFGHGRLDGSMFGTLKDTLTTDWQKSNADKQIILVTENETNIYEVFSTYKILVEDYYLKNEFTNNDEYEAFLGILKKRSNFDYNVELTSEDQILTLSTCDVNNNYRIVLHARRINN